MRLEFEGQSDDTFGEYAVFGDDYDNCASGEPIEWLVSNGEDSLIVVGQYSVGGRGGWMIGVQPHDPEDDDRGVPDWPICFEPNGYRGRLVIEVPGEATIRCLQREEGEG